MVVMICLNKMLTSELKWPGPRYSEGHSSESGSFPAHFAHNNHAETIIIYMYMYAIFDI